MKDLLPTGTRGSASRSSPRVLYIVYWGAVEPLGRSLVLPAVMKLSERGARVSLVTFEKPDDLAREDVVADIRARLRGSGVAWLPLKYHKTPRVPATAFDFSQGVVRSIVASLSDKPDIVHARTFVGGLIGSALARLLRARLIYHNEGFYPDEQVDAGVWQADSAPHRVAKRLERKLYLSSDAVITLSRKAEGEVRGLLAANGKGAPVVVVPSCVDLDRFGRRRPPPFRRGDEMRLLYVGSMGGRYMFDGVGRFAAVATGDPGGARLRVLTRTDPAAVASILSASGLPAAAWSVASAAHDSVPDETASQHAGFSFLRQGISEHGGSPTKVGEYWASGLPVVATPNISDLDSIIRRERVGVIVRDHSDAGYRRAVAELKELLGEEDLARRCRRAAETHYALAPACERQFALYLDLLRRAETRRR